MIPISLLTCPICLHALQQDGQLLRCTQQHTFDLAREGYVNLLRKQLPGDTRAMLLARRDFLEQGHYLPLAEHMRELIARNLSAEPDRTSCILDAGCGEGYYLGWLLQGLAQRSLTVTAVGMDISKDAIRMAAKRYREAFFVVGSINQPFAFRDQAFHLVLNMFAPRNACEFARVLLPDGLLLVVIPGESHLARLRSSLELLSIEEHKQQHVIDQLAAQFTLLETSTLRYTLRIERAVIRQLVIMTPNYWHFSSAQQAMLESLEWLETEAEFVCLLFRRGT